MEFLFFILCAHGITQILCYGKIFNNIRPKKGKLGELFSCSMCIGFWVGIFLGGIEQFSELFSLSSNLIDVFLLGCISSSTSYMLDKIVSDEGINIHKG